MSPRRLELDFIAPSRRRRWAGYLLLAVSLFVAADMMVRHRAVRLELERIEVAQGLLGTERRVPRPVPKERVDELAKNVEAVVRQLTLPWATLIGALEDVATKDVALLQLHPEAQQRVLRVTAEARHQEAMLEYARRLAAAKGFADVHLVSHQVREDDPQRPIQFSLQASFRGMP